MTDFVRRARLFIGSYALLFVLLAVRFKTPWLEALCGAVALVGILDMAWMVFVVSRRTGADPIRVGTVEDAGPEVAGYLATYLLPFLTVAEPTVRDLIAYALFLIVTGLVYVRSEMTQINPTLYVFGRRVAKITTDRGWSGHIVVRHPLTVGQSIRAVPLSAAVRVETSRSEAA